MPLTEIVERHAATRDAWDAVVEASPEGWVFALSGWLDLVAEVPRWGLRDVSFAIKQDNRLVAVIPLQEVTAERRLSCGGWSCTMPTIVGDLADGERQRILQTAFGEIRRRAKRAGASRIDFGVSPVCRTALESRNGINPLLAFGVSDASSHSRILDLALSEEQIHAQLAQDARQKIKRAQTDGLTAEPVAWVEALDRYYELHCETYRRTGATAHMREYFSGIARHLDGRHAVLWAARDRDGTIIAFHHDLRTASGCQYHMGCSTLAALESGANYLLFWHAILGAKAAGCRWYEIGEVFPGVLTGKEHGLSVFKSKFGGDVYRSFRGSILLEDRDSNNTIVPVAAPNLKTLLREWLRASYRLSAAVIGDDAAANARSIAVGGYRRARAFAHTTGAGVRAVKLAAVGRIPFMRPLWDATEEAAAVATNGDTRLQLEQAFRTAGGLQDDAAIVLTSSGRTALQLALSILAAKNPQRRRVLLPSYSCRGLYDPIVNLGLIPEFVEVDEDLLPDTQDMIPDMGPDVLACFAVHLCGCRMAAAPLIASAAQHGVAVIEDCCHYLGSGLTSDADFQIFSVGLGKTAMATAGGALASRRFANDVRAVTARWPRDDSTAAALRYRHFHKTYFQASGWPPEPLSSELYTQFESRLISDVDAQLALVQLDKLPHIVRKRQEFGRRMRAVLSERSDLFRLQAERDHIHTKLTVTCLVKPAADRLAHVMTAHGIKLEPMYLPLHMRDFAAAYARRPLRFTETLSGRVYNIPIRPNLTEPELQRIERALRKVVSTASA